MENQNITFCGIKPSQKNNIEPHESLTGFCEKSVEVLDELQDRKVSISKCRKVNKFWQKLFDQP